MHASKALDALRTTLRDGKLAFQAFRDGPEVLKGGAQVAKNTDGGQVFGSGCKRAFMAESAWLRPSLPASLAHVMEWLSSCVECNSTRFAEDTVRVVTCLYFEPMH